VEDNRDYGSGFSHYRGLRRSRRDNGIDLEAYEIGCHLCGSFGAPLRPANINGDIAAVDPSEFAQPLYKSG
jgi:hypothetical protein